MTQIRSLLVLIFLAVWSMGERSSRAQAPITPPVPPPSAEGWSGTVILGLAAVAVVVILGVVVKLYDRRQRREAEAIGLQSRLSDVLLTERTLQGTTVTPTVRAALWGRSPLVIEVSGDVPTPEMRDMVLRVVRLEASRLRPDVEVEDKVLIMPVRTGHAA